MKTLRILAAAVAAILLCSSCGVIGGASAGADAAAGTSILTAANGGQNAGAALRSLYTQYKADGNKLNTTNLTNIANMATLAQSIQGLKGQPLSGTYCVDFAKGLVTGSKQTVTQQASSAVTSALSKLVGSTDLSGLTNTASSAAQKAQTAATAAQSITSILGLLGK